MTAGPANRSGCVCRSLACARPAGCGPQQRGSDRSGPLQHGLGGRAARKGL